MLRQIKHLFLTNLKEVSISTTHQHAGDIPCL